MARLCMVGADMAGRALVWFGPAGQGMVGRCMAWRGSVRPGAVWLGKSRQGEEITTLWERRVRTVQLAFAFDGTTGLLQHNPRLIDKTDDISREIAVINAKRKKTEADEAERDRLEWFGGLYHAQDIGIYMPAASVIRCLVDAGTAIKKGKAVRQGIAIGTDRIPLEYDGPRALDELYARPEFRSRLPVVVMRQRVMRMRPIFRRWRLEFDAEMDEAIWNLDELTNVAERAGRIGLGDARAIGYGRFAAVVVANATRAEVLHGSNGRGQSVPAARR
jgi:hypothetical protein